MNTPLLANSPNATAPPMAHDTPVCPWRADDYLRRRVAGERPGAAGPHRPKSGRLHCPLIVAPATIEENTYPLTAD
jgi:hypothetical protein